jgi:hypothetical protein
MIDPVVFCHKIWAYQNIQVPVGYVLFCRKDWVNGDPNDWHNFPQKWPKLSLPEGNDIYFTPNFFNARRRLEENTLPSRVLFADLDAVDPRAIKDVPPTIGWETSPGRFQGIWLVDRSLPWKRFNRLNHRLTDYVGADGGGWACNKVLRPPGAMNNKYSEPFQVHIVSKGPKYLVEDLHALLPQLQAGRPPELEKLLGASVAIPKYEVVLRNWKAQLPKRALSLIRVKEAIGTEDRSARLWELHNLLLQAGMPPAAVLSIVRRTAWNKYRGQRRELEQLQKEIAKAAQQYAHEDEINRLRGMREAVKSNGGGATALKIAKRQAEAGRKILFMSKREFMSYIRPQPQWLVEHILMDGAYGLCAGQAKSYKTWLLLDLAESVTTGKAFLGQDRFRVHRQGRVLYLHEEGSVAAIQDRLHRIDVAKGVAARVKRQRGSRNGAGSTEIIAPKGDEDLRIASFTGFDLTDKEYRDDLLVEIKEFKPILIILESWYLMTSDADENVAAQVGPILDWLRLVSHEHNTALIVSHHYNKGSGDNGRARRSIERMSGSSSFGRWLESGIYLERVGDEGDNTVALETQHRDQMGMGRMTLRMNIDRDDENDYSVEIIEEENEVSPLQMTIDEIRACIGYRGRATGKEAMEACRANGIAYSKVKGSLDSYGLAVKVVNGPVNKEYIIKAS